MASEKPGAGAAKGIFGLWRGFAPALGRSFRAAEPHIKKVEHLVGDTIAMKVNEYHHVMLLAIGLVVNFHGNNFSKLIIASQTIKHMSFDTIRSTLTELWADAQLARVHLKKIEEDQKSSKKSVEGEGKAMNEALKLIDPVKVSRCAMAAFAAVMACAAALGNSVAQACAIGVFLTKIITDHADAYLKEHDVYEGLDEWVNLGINAAVHFVLISLTWLTGSVMLILHHVVLGSSLLIDGSLELAEKLGRIDAGAADTLRHGQYAHGARAVLILAGFYWQLSSNGVGMFFIPYFPLVMLEYLVDKFL